MVYLGTPKNGPRWVNCRAEADRIVIISSVEPHYFAGWHWGASRSSLIAAFDIYRAELRWRSGGASAAPGGTWHEDMIDASRRSKKIFINTVLDRDHWIYAAAAGDIYRCPNPRSPGLTVLPPKSLQG